MSVVCSAVFKNGVIVPDWKLDLKEGAEYVVTVEGITPTQRQQMIIRHQQEIERDHQKPMV